MNECISLYQRPGLSHPEIVEQIVSIAKELTGEWFTPDVPEAVPWDLQFQDALCLEANGGVQAFITFTSSDGAINLTLVGVRPVERGKGLGSRLMEHLFAHVTRLGFGQIEVLTVPPAHKPCYEATVGFYQKHGFAVEKEIADLWESCPALKLVKVLPG